MQAFPRTGITDSRGTAIDQPGMSMREWYAGQVLSEIYGKQAKLSAYDIPDPKLVAELAFKMADEMIAQSGNR